MHIFLIAAVTKDGFIARSQNDRSFDWTSTEDKAFYISKIKEADAVVMGSTTFRTFTKYPKGKTYVILTHHPEAFVNPKPDVITTIPTNASALEILKDLESRGMNTIAIAGGSSVYNQFMDTGLINTLYLTQEDVEFGSGIPLFAKPFDLKPTSTTELAPKTILFEYRLRWPSI